MLTNKERAWLNRNRELILKLADLQERGVDVEAMFDVTMDLIKLHDRSKQANFDLVALTTFIVEERSAQSAEVGLSQVGVQQTSLQGRC